MFSTGSGNNDVMTKGSPVSFTALMMVSGQESSNNKRYEIQLQ
jgi:hypothetical protein